MAERPTATAADRSRRSDTFIAERSCGSDCALEVAWPWRQDRAGNCAPHRDPFSKKHSNPFFARLAHVLSACNVAPMVVIDAVQENIISAIKAVIENGRLAAKGLRGAAQRGTVSRVVRPGWCVAKDPDEWPIELENGWAEWLLIRIIEW
ncbi:hypothetical protein [Burkholderia sp. LMG 13014]|uniref:hypothetical protein n=2 Tax=Burkholderiaceae TaxID=119060 RepID=UPI0019637007|nr:hypothetical protein [Burkholderia sp. LMG 13014]